MRATLALRRDELARYRERAGLRRDTDLAKAMGVSRTTVCKFLNGQSQPTAPLIASLLDALGRETPFADLFAIVPTPEQEGMAGA